MKNLLIVFLVLMNNVLFGLDVSGVKAVRTGGQVFISWKGDASKAYVIYRTTYKITAATGWPAVAFGQAPAYSSKNIRLSELLTDAPKYFRIPADNAGNMQVLDPASGYGGLFVLACTNNGIKYFYGVKMVGSPDGPVAGENATTTATKDIIATPKPFLQESLNFDALPDNDMDIYVHFVTAIVPSGARLMMNAGFFDFLGFNFGLVPFTDVSSAAPHPLIVKLHAGGSNFIEEGINAGTIATSAYKLCLDDWLPNGETSWWFGYNEKFDIAQPYVHEVTLPPSCNTACLLNDPTCHGTNRDYTLQRILYSIEQVKSLYNNAPNTNPADNININKVSLSGRSMGGGGSVLAAMIAPDVFSCVSVVVPKFDFSFSNDQSMDLCAWDFDIAAEAVADPCYDYNLYLVTRERSNARWGTVTSNWPSNISGLINSGTYYKTYDLLNAGFMIAENSLANKDLPIIFAYSGKNDSGQGWEEKLPVYDSMNSHQQPGIFFWDQGEHKKPLYWDFGASIPLTDLIRYSSKQAYPAFSNCTINDLPETSLQGTINGFFDWDETTIADSKTDFSMQLKWRVLKDINGNTVHPANPDMMTDITLRRQKFPGATYSGAICWTLTNLTTLAAVSGESSVPYPNGPVTISGLALHYPDKYQLTITTVACKTASPVAGSTASLIIEAYPNPFNDLISINILSKQKEKVNIVVLDVYGNEMIQQHFVSGEENPVLRQLNTHAWNPGIYMLRITTENESVVKPILKIR